MSEENKEFMPKEEKEIVTTPETKCCDTEHESKCCDTESHSHCCGTSSFCAHLPFILSALSLVLVVVLYVLFFLNKGKSIDSFQKKNGASISVAYINFDSLMIHYNMVKVMKDSLMNKKNTLEADVINRQKTLQTKIDNYKDNVQNNRITMQQAQAAEQKLMQEQQDLLSLREGYLSQLAEDQSKLDMIIQDSVINYVHRINNKYNFDYVLGFSKGGGIVLANDTLNITKMVVDGLNEEYKKK